MEQTLDALETCLLGLGIYTPSVKLHSWSEILENSIWSLKSPGEMAAIFCTSPVILFFALTGCIFIPNIRQKEELIKELAKSDKEAKETKKQFSERIKSMKQELEKAKKELEDSRKALEEYESKANYEVSEKQKVEAEYKKKLQTVEAKLQALKRKQKVGKCHCFFFLVHSSLCFVSFYVDRVLVFAELYFNANIACLISSSPLA